MLIWLLVLTFSGDRSITSVTMPGHFMTPEECMPAGETAKKNYTGYADGVAYTCVPQPADAEDKKTQ